MAQLVYSEAELLSEHDYASPHVVAGHRLHGGFLADGSYQPPRALGREQALAAWEAALRERGGQPFHADAALLTGVRVPNVEQHCVLLRHGLGETFWASLTVIGKIEARGRLLAEARFPALQPFIVDDVSGMALGHLSSGLLLAHGLDEGGLPAEGIGGHDVMWFVARDLAFGPDAFPDVEPPANIARPEAGRRWMPEVDPAVEGVLSLLMNLLVIEFRAELGFAASQAVLRTPGLFPTREEQAELAAEVIERIRTDERIHVRSLCLILGEACSVRFRTLEGGQIAGSELVERFWAGLVRWATVEQPPLAAAQQWRLIESRLEGRTDAGAILAELHAASGA